MATSGSFETNSVGNLGGSPNRIKSSWSLANQSVGGNYSDINWNLRGWGGNGGYWSYKYSSRAYIEGDQVHSTGSTMQMYQNSIFASGTKRVYHASNGALTLNISAYGAVYSASENTSGSGSWSLPTIPREASITSAPNFTDESNPTIGYSNPAGSSVTSLKACIADGSNVVVPYRNISQTGSSYTFNLTEGERELLRAETPTSKTKSLRFYVQTVIGGNTYTDYLTRTLTIVNGEPTFSTFTHKDVNSATVAITGDDQYYIQGQSELEITILGVDKAIAIKEATMDVYNVAVGSLSVNIPYSATDIVENVGTLGVNSNSVLAVKATDSRGFITAVTDTINVLPYVAPQIEVLAERTNNFEAETTINIEATISRLTIASVDKNAVNTSTGVKYRYKATDSGTWGSWVNVANTTTGDRVTATPVVLTLDNTKSFNVEVQVIDKLNTSTASIVVERGVPVFFIDQEGRVAVNGVPADYSADPTEDATNPTKLDVFGAIRSNGKKVAVGLYGWSYHSTSNQSTGTSGVPTRFQFDQSVAETFGDGGEMTTDGFMPSVSGWARVTLTVSIIGGAGIDDSMLFGFYYGSKKIMTNDNWRYQSPSSGIEAVSSFSTSFRVEAGEEIRAVFEDVQNSITLLGGKCHFDGLIIPD